MNLITFLRRLNSTCWFGHGDRLRDRDRKGRMVLVCSGCGDSKIVLPDLPRSRKPVAPAKPTRLVLRKRA
jgi:hypothetical protein